MNILLCSSCKTVREESVKQVVATTIQLAEAKVEQGNLDEAIEIYARANEEVLDYRLIYNEAAVHAKNADYETASELCLYGYRQFPEQTAFLTALASYQSLNGQIEDAKATFEEYFNVSNEDVSTKLKYCTFCVKNGYIQDAYDMAISLWDHKDYSAELVNILYEIDPEQWNVMHQVFLSDTSEQE